MGIRPNVITYVYVYEDDDDNELEVFEFLEDAIKYGQDRKGNQLEFRTDNNRTWYSEWDAYVGIHKLTIHTG